MSEVVETSILKLGLPAPLRPPSQLVTAPHALIYRLLHPAQRAVAQRLCGVPSMFDSLGVKVPCPT